MQEFKGDNLAKQTLFRPLGVRLGQGNIRAFSVVRLGDEPYSKDYAATREHYMDINKFLTSAEFGLAQKVYESGLKREDHRLVLPLSYERVGKNIEDGEIQVYYPKIGDGETLLDKILESKHFDGHTYFPIRQTAQIIKDIATGIDVVHDFGYSHSDIKPSNILTEKTRAFLADFNISATFSFKNDVNQFFHIVDILLVGREIDKIFESGKANCDKSDFIQGWVTLDGGFPIRGVVDVDGRVEKLLVKSYPLAVINLIKKYEEDEHLKLSDFATKLQKLLLKT